ncbi:MAG: thiamine biosynthesis protein ApbE [Firmicutes bacterium HGW-Firmicutes-1]|jgi:thiamine biosynthesis lipoprotein|nr:MAG: thiamine biosynthesis protein ApbE [Firmicutes bacterium HGW-Firmicutes-1]
MKKLVLSIMIIILILLTSCNNNSYQKYSKDGFVLGTIVSITIYSKEIVDAAEFKVLFDQLLEIEKKMTINKQVNSEVEQINKLAGKEAVVVSDETFYVIQKGVEYTKLTNNRFDITVGALVKLWNIGFENERVPTQNNIEESLALIGIDDVILNEKEHSVKLKRDGMMIDLGGIAKGYAADVMSKLMGEMGYQHAIINLGGNILCHGSKPEGEAFKIGIRDPYKTSEDYVGIVEKVNTAVVTSGIYERNFTENEIMYHHILDTSSGYPVNNELASVTIITQNSTYADALSTGVFSMGIEEGLEFTQQLDDVEAIFISTDKKIYMTTGAKKLFSYTGEGYQIQ